MSEDIAHEKRALRAELRERRQQLSEPARADAAEGVREQLLALVERYGARSMACFLSIPTEPGTALFLREAARRGIRVLLPITRADGLLDWGIAESELDVHTGILGLPEPAGEPLSPMAVNDVDLLVIPAAAVDRGGMRLGWGRGYYDKTLGSMEQRPPVYAVVFDSEIVDEVPRELHDQPVTGVVTPSRTIDFADRPR